MSKWKCQRCEDEEFIHESVYVQLDGGASRRALLCNACINEWHRHSDADDAILAFRLEVAAISSGVGESATAERWKQYVRDIQPLRQKGGAIIEAWLAATT